MLLKNGILYDTYAKHLNHNDRAICESRNGLYKVHTKKGTDEILGATLVGGPAGDLISHITSAMTNKIGLSKLASCVYPYPTYAEAFKQMADSYNKTKLTPGAKKLIKAVLKMKS